MKRLGFIAAIAILVIPAGTPGEPDSFGVGQGTSPLPVTGPGTVINSYTQVTGPLLPGDTSIPVSFTPDFSSGNLVMVLQTTGIVPEPSSGQPGPFDISNDPVGHWEFARLASGTTTTRLQLTASLIYSYAAGVTQVIQVPEYQSVTISPGASLVPLPWNGSTGGVLAFLVQGRVDNAGQINANGAIPVGGGFRGGQAVRDPRPPTLPGVCNALDEPPRDGGQKGEGIASTRYGTGLNASGRGNVANGAGGGNCFNAGGGGGGNGGAGGNGGFSWVGNRPVGGLGGGALNFFPLTRLALGGGGGAGHQSGVGTGSSGGRGGGIVFIRGNAMSGTGTVTANGQSAIDGGLDDGAGGGGAGGTIYLRFVGQVGNVGCSVTANGGSGGGTAGDGGPGGGGGGGNVLIDGSSIVCPISTLGGLPGQQPDAGRYGADAGSGGVSVARSGGFRLLSQPTIVTPADGSSTTNRRPPMSGTADSNVTVILYLDGSELTPRISSSGTGSFSFTPSADLSLGLHRVQAATEFEAVRSPLSSPNNFTIVAADAGTPDGGDAGTPDGGGGPEFSGGGCSCGSAGGGVILPALLFAIALIRRRDARQAG